MVPLVQVHGPQPPSMGPGEGKVELTGVLTDFSPEHGSVLQDISFVSFSFRRPYSLPQPAEVQFLSRSTWSFNSHL